jgi:hypothetical protein
MKSQKCNNLPAKLCYSSFPVLDVADPLPDDLLDVRRGVLSGRACLQIPCSPVAVVYTDR